MAERVQIEVSSPILGKHQVFSGTDYDAVMAKAQALQKTWEIQEQAQNAARSAEVQTTEAKIKLENITNILRSALEPKQKLMINWAKLVKPYPLPIPTYPKTVVCPPKPKSNEPAKPVYLPYPVEPPADIWEPGSEFSRRAIEAYSKWAEQVKRIETENQRRYDENVAAIEKWTPALQAQYEQALARWNGINEQTRAENLRLKNEYTAALARWKASRIEYEEKEIARLKVESLLPEKVVDYYKWVLSLSKFPENFRDELDLEYVPETKILIVDCLMPSPEGLPRVKELKYVKFRNETVEVFLSEKELNQIYDDVLYQICLRTIYELFETDAADALSAVVFNGWVASVDKATGKDTKGCVMSVHAKREEFQKINLARVDPKVCFKTLKGVSSSTLHSLTPIAPVLKINREDKRFVASYAVAGQLDERTNLAAMDWEDFEHLIRELFEKEFSKPGCEVKVTQASRDGGVDSVVLDSDPIHGGKTVIQAKRYTNTVGVAAVRELWGTVLNEGAMKGILVTTADYGPDAYEFAKGKPLVLLNGANLLHLLEKHGHKAKIDIQEAKRVLAEKES